MSRGCVMSCRSPASCLAGNLHVLQAVYECCHYMHASYTPRTRLVHASYTQVRCTWCRACMNTATTCKTNSTTTAGAVCTGPIKLSCPGFASSTTLTCQFRYSVTLLYWYRSTNSDSAALHSPANPDARGDPADASTDGRQTTTLHRLKAVDRCYGGANAPRPVSRSKFTCVASTKYKK